MGLDSKGRDLDWLQMELKVSLVNSARVSQNKKQNKTEGLEIQSADRMLV